MDDLQEIQLELRLEGISDDVTADELDQLTESARETVLGAYAKEAYSPIQEQSKPGKLGGDITPWVLIIAVLPATLPAVINAICTWSTRTKEYVKTTIRYKGVEISWEHPRDYKPDEVQRDIEQIVEQIKKMVDSEEKSQTPKRKHKGS
jgi:hypothetical protein